MNRDTIRHETGYRPDSRFWSIVLVFVVVKVGLHLMVGAGWGFQRDELLYLAEGRHVDWGFWSTPPFIGAIAWFVQLVSSGGPAAVHFVAMLASTATLVLVALLTRDLGGGPWAVALACLAVLTAPGLLRTGALFQPVVFDVFFWTFGAWIVLQYVRSGKDGWIWALGPVVGLGFLNKYSIAFFVLGMAVAAALTPQRTIFRRKALWGAVALATVVVLPNLLWQVAHRFPVVTHVHELSMYQLGNVTSAGFMLDQILTYLPGLIVWVAGLVWLFRTGGRRFRVFGWYYVVVLVLMLLLSGKSYYTMGTYPVLMAAGGVVLERVSTSLRVIVATIAVVVGLALSPYSLPYMSVDGMVAYSRKTVELLGTDAPLRWEDGQVYALPQDYADMLGWQQIAGLADRAVQEGGDPARTLIYAENYGQAGAIEYYSGHEVIGFNDSYRLWAPDRLPPGFSTLVYVNYELGADIDSLFADKRLIGSVTNPLAREYGATVWLCRDPSPEIGPFYTERVAGVKASFRRP